MAKEKMFNLVDDLNFKGTPIKIKGTGTKEQPPVTEKKKRVRPIYANEGETYQQFLGSQPVMCGIAGPGNKALLAMQQMMGSVPQVSAVKIEEAQGGGYTVTPNVTGMGNKVIVRINAGIKTTAVKKAED